MIIVGPPSNNPFSWIKWGFEVRRPIDGVTMCFLELASFLPGKIGRYFNNKFCDRL